MRAHNFRDSITQKKTKTRTDVEISMKKIKIPRLKQEKKLRNSEPIEINTSASGKFPQPHYKKKPHYDLAWEF